MSYPIRLDPIDYPTGDYQAPPISEGLRISFPLGYQARGSERGRRPFPWGVVLAIGIILALLVAS